MDREKPVAEFVTGKGDLTITLDGEWVIDFAPEMHDILMHLPKFSERRVVIDGGKIRRFDTFGAWLLFSMFQRAKTHGLSFRDRNFSKHLTTLINRTGQLPKNRPKVPVEPNPFIKRLMELGAINVFMCTHYGQLFTFIGFTLIRAFKALLKPRHFRLTSFVYHIEEVGFKALGIIGLMTFLIGAVIVNQGAIQLRQFGAEVFAVDLLAVAQLREMGVLLAAILIAGRSGSAFTAEIGSMKVREEVDALEVLGLNAVDVLVLPRMMALIFILPFVAFFADIMGALGGALMSWSMLDIPFTAFWGRFRDAIPLTTFYIGLIKAPFFGALIAINGCFEGLTVEGSAESVGRNTTRSVVQSIFMVIVLDALFALFFTAVDW